MTSGQIRYDQIADVATLTIDAPHTRNALTRAMVDQLRTGLERAAIEARAVHLTGAGAGFCAGANLAEDDGMNRPDADGGRILVDHYNPLMRTIRQLGIPLVVSLKGPVVGVGASIALSGDLIFAEESAFLMLPFSKIGLIPDGGVARTLVQAIGRPRAARIMLTAERISAATALAWGLVTELAPDGQADELASAAASALAAGPTAALGAIRRLAWTAMDDDFEAQLDHEVVVQRELAIRADYREGVAAFMAKRPAQFDGL